MKIVPIRTSPTQPCLFPSVDLNTGGFLVRGDGVLARAVVQDGVEVIVVMTRKERRSAWREACKSAKALGQTPPPWSPQTTLRQLGYQLNRQGDGVEAVEVDDTMDDGKPEVTEEQGRALSVLSKLAKGAGGGLRRMMRGGDR